MTPQCSVDAALMFNLFVSASVSLLPPPLDPPSCCSHSRSVSRMIPLHQFCSLQFLCNNIQRTNQLLHQLNVAHLGVVTPETRTNYNSKDAKCREHLKHTSEISFTAGDATLTFWRALSRQLRYRANAINPLFALIVCSLQCTQRSLRSVSGLSGMTGILQVV